MAKYFSASTGGFYTPDVHTPQEIPADSHEISDGEWQQLLTAQAQGKQIVSGTHGGPIAIDRKPTAEDVIARRDRALADSDWLVVRHRDEVENGDMTTITAQQYSDLQAWRRALRSITSSPGFPNVSIPERPI